MKASAMQPVWLLALVPLLFAAMCLPMALEWIGPNGFYGVRIEATRVSDVAWYRINRISGIAGVVAGLAGFLANLLVMRSGMAVPPCATLAIYFSAFFWSGWTRCTKRT